MKMNEWLTRALAVAIEAHEGQLDKGGYPYILHPLRMMHEARTMPLKIVALLHDVLEESEYTVTKLREKGFPEEILDAVVAITREPEENYEDYIVRVSQNELAREVKLSDLRDNLNLARLRKLDQADIQRIERYHRALQYLTTL